MVIRTYNMPDDKITQKTFLMPSENKHTFQVVDVYTNKDKTGIKFNLDDDTVIAKCESFEEDGRSLLNRVTLDENNGAFFRTRLFLKSFGFPHKGDGVIIDTDEWIGHSFTAYVVHKEGNNGKKYANIGEYIFPEEKPQTARNEETEWDKA